MAGSASEVEEAECPVCGTVADAFLPGGRPDRPRPDCRCPGCGSLERHRAFWLFYRERTGLFADALRMLHVAPEPCLAKRFRRLPNITYLSADLNPAKAMIALDLTQSTLPDNGFDVIHASHVLEHISDDVAAMRELHRMLSPGGLALLAVPVWGDTTQEDPAITDPAERARRYGQADHVRMYGRDGILQQRLRTAGFSVTEDRLIKDMEPALRRRYRVRAREPIFACVA